MSEASHRPTGAVAQLEKGVARVSGRRGSVGERPNGGSQPRSTDPRGAGGAEQLLVVDCTDEHECAQSRRLGTPGVHDGAAFTAA